jgi:3-oxoadipate enol-lactonase
MPSVPTAPDQTIFYREFNPTGKTVVLLLHGLGATGESWSYQVPDLEKAGFRVIAPDARGFGRSSYPGITSVKEMAADMAALLERLKISQLHVVGISMGGTIALQLALDYPDCVDRLVLVNTFAQLRPKNMKSWMYFFIRFLLIHTVGIHTQARTVARRVFPRPEQAWLRQELMAQIHQANASGYRATMRALGMFRVEKRLGEINTPTLVVTGENDNTVAPKNQQILVEKIKSARHVIIPDGGHAVAVDQPAVFNQVLLEFLTENMRHSS